MPDREKVIKGLECCSAMSGDECRECPYEHECRATDLPYGMSHLAADALSLLKEQETVKPKKIKGYNPPMYTLYEYECEKCESPMMNKQPFCMGCGQEVTWGGCSNP